MRDPEPAVRCLELAASFGSRWRPSNAYAFSTLRRAIGGASSYLVLPLLERITRCGAIEPEVFRELMKTPRMKAVLNSGAPGCVRLRELAGHTAQRRQRGKKAFPA